MNPGRTQILPRAFWPAFSGVNLSEEGIAVVVDLSGNDMLWKLTLFVFVQHNDPGNI